MAAAILRKRKRVGREAPRKPIVKATTKHSPRARMSKRASNSSRRKGKQKTQAKGFPVVGVGASAGGYEAFTKFLEKLPGDTGMAFVLIQHLDPTHESR